MNRSHKRAESDAPERPITFRAAEDLGAFELAQLWADYTAWNLNERTEYDELAELACMSALAKWLIRWQPLAIHGAVLAGARMEAIAGAFGSSLQVTFGRWHEWALRQRDFIIGGKPGISEDEYEVVARRFGQLIMMHGTLRAASSSSRVLEHLRMLRLFRIMQIRTRTLREDGDAF